MENVRKPSILVPYSGPDASGNCKDVFIYLRPESNGVYVESSLLKVIRGKSLYLNNTSLVYLANLPGDFIVNKHIIERHYSVKLYFAAHGKNAFTKDMIKRFEAFFQESFNDAKIIGAFEALRKFDIDYNELFHLWVNPFDMLVVNGQSIKKKDDYYIVNYDIPALLHKNSKNTDIAVMVVRTSLIWDDFHKMVEDMGAALIEAGLMDPLKPASRFFHYSKGPFSEIQDGIGYLYHKDGTSIEPTALSFVQYLMNKGFSIDQVLGMIHNPIMAFRDEDDSVVEESLYDWTVGDDYEAAFEKMKKCVNQFILR